MYTVVYASGGNYFSRAQPFDLYQLSIAASPCDTDINECTTNNPCVRGTCDNTIGSYTCTCPLGYGGANCQTQCPTGFTGTSCDTDINECTTNNPCVRGTCDNTIGSYTCTCPLGYGGANCQTQCPTGFTGTSCDTDINECTTNNPCVRGTCDNTIGSYTCTCPLGYGGANCQTQCPTGFTGTSCDTDINECTTNNPCKNGGTCDNTIGSYTCTCSTCYSGATCATLNFAGFFQPIDNEPVANVIKLGQAVPVKFSLGCNNGLSIFAPGFPKVAPAYCTTGQPEDAVPLSTATAGASSLSYDPTSGQYSYVWKTPSDARYAGTCQYLVLQFADGTQRRALFKFR
ncbi:hypothetical protein HYH03_006901 [Edaphochlamys debaryana]|uniref:EGF-like domain-containing protein n=1 Tax=Edaphochlamys debaryana TaxID=47281 RepID=A0A836C0J5_9CHLO|nr:hypothetical protein HYH03_006901 [Edaphochlamys debaryana]|eukprot:KAG2494967.1 hypothetical protein HYH03_006901 [Edaphochlamys debaryana]